MISEGLKINSTLTKLNMSCDRKKKGNKENKRRKQKDEKYFLIIHFELYKAKSV